MVKESSTRESNELGGKKRKKDDLLTTKISSNEAIVYKQVTDMEEAEAELRNQDDDANQFQSVCEEFRKMVAEVSKLKSKSRDKMVGEKIAEKKTDAAMLFVEMKSLNRLQKIGVNKKFRESQLKMKQDVDSLHFQLQNLNYEVLHLKKEINKCLQFKSKHEDIDLVPVEEFYKDAPENISKPSITATDSHKQTLARLEWELQQRKQLAVQCQNLQSEKEVVAVAIQKRKSRIDDLAPLLKQILEVVKPVQENLGLVKAAKLSYHQTANLLPHPLYYLYVQADAQSEVFGDKYISVSINGDEEEAQRLFRTVSESESQDESDSDVQEESNNKRHRKKSKVDRLEERKKQLLMKHPLSVNITLILKSGNSINLTFYNLISLHIVSVKIKVNLIDNQGSVCGSNLIAGESILSDLFAGDNGLNSPNVANHYQLRRVGLDAYDSGKLGLAYNWAQRLCGLDFLSADAGRVVEPNSSVSQSCFSSIITAIKGRLDARVQLYKQVQALESGTLYCPVQIQNVCPTTLGNTLGQWQTITYSDFVSLPFGRHVSTLCSESDVFYKMVITRGSALMTAVCAVKNNYPATVPLFAVQLNWLNKLFDVSNSESIRDLEKEVNIHSKELCSTPKLFAWVLSAQLHRLRMCFDIFVEARGNVDIPREKVFLSQVRRRNRALPYKYMKTGGGIFVHR